jgi:hypothetical protein
MATLIAGLLWQAARLICECRVISGSRGICASAVTREHLVLMTDYGANLIWGLIYFTLPTREDTKVHFFTFGQPREFQNNVHF